MIALVMLAVFGTLMVLGTLFLRYVIKIKKIRKALVAEYLKLAQDVANADWLSLSEDEWHDFISRAEVLHLKMEEYQIDAGKFFPAITFQYDAVSFLKNTDDETIKQEISMVLAENKRLLLKSLKEIDPPR